MSSAIPPPVETFHRGIEELAEARTKSDRLKGREAAEKVWLAVVEATDHYLALKGVVIASGPRAHMQRRRAFATLDRDDLRRTYSDLASTLHGDIFYFDDLSEGGRELDSLYEEAARYVEETTGEHGLLSEVLDMERATSHRTG